MVVACYICCKDCASLDKYVDHLKNSHHLIEPCSVRCNFGGCLRSFNSYNSLRKHVKREHTLDGVNGIVDFSSVDSVITGPEHDGDCSSFMEYCEGPKDDSNVEDYPCVDECGVVQAAMKFVLTLMSSSSIPLTTADFVKNCTQELVGDIVKLLKSRTLSAFSNLGVNEMPEVTALIDEFDTWSDPFKGIESNYKLLSYLKRRNLYIPPNVH